VSTDRELLATIYSIASGLYDTAPEASICDVIEASERVTQLAEQLLERLAILEDPTGPFQYR
jgi:hypothetical protein